MLLLLVVLAADVELQFPGHGLQLIAARYLIAFVNEVDSAVHIVIQTCFQYTPLRSIGA